MDDLLVTLVAPVRITGPTRSVRLRSGHGRGLVARLALSAGCFVSNDDICTALWDEGAPLSSRSNLRKYTSGVRSALREAGVSDAALDVIPASRGNFSSGGICLDVTPANVDVLEAEAAVRKASRLLPTAPHDARSEAERGIVLLGRRAFATDLPSTRWFDDYRRWADRHLLRLREIRCVADLLTGNVFEAALEAEQLASESSLTYLKAASRFFENRSVDALDVIAVYRGELAEFGLDLPRNMSDLQLAILNADQVTVRTTLVASSVGAG